MTDKKNIKALEDYIKENEFEYFHSNMMNEYPLIRKSLDIINRQKAEIERLNKKVEELADVLSGTIRIRYAEAKAEAYKEFAEKIKKSIKENVDEAWHRDDGNGIYDAEYVLDDIDNLLKEMVGEEE